MTTAHEPAHSAVLHYTVKHSCLEEHLSLLAAVYAELDRLQPGPFRWATYRVTGTREFVEVATAHPLPGPLPTLPTFQRYRSGLDDRCETRRFDDVTVVGLFAAT